MNDTRTPFEDEDPEVAIEEVNDFIDMLLSPIQSRIHDLLMERVKEIIGHEPSQEECMRHASFAHRPAEFVTPDAPLVLKGYKWEDQPILKIVVRAANHVEAVKIYPPSPVTHDTAVEILGPNDTHGLSPQVQDILADMLKKSGDGLGGSLPKGEIYRRPN